MTRAVFQLLRKFTESLATFDAVLSDRARAFVRSLNWFEQAEFQWALQDLMRDPHPDGRGKVELDTFPYGPGTLAFTGPEFWMVYRFLNATTIGIASVYWRPDSPRRGGELLEI